MSRPVRWALCALRFALPALIFGLALVDEAEAAPGLTITNSSAVSENTAYYVDWTAASPSAGTASGTITLGDNSTIGVTFSAKTPGGVAVPYHGAQTSGGGTNFWNPTTPYISTQVPNAPPTTDILQLSGGSNTVYRVTFTAAIQDPIMSIVSLGAPSAAITYDFDAPFTILSQDRGYWGGTTTSLTQLPGDILRGAEGHGTIKFLGSYSTFSWTVPTNETWHGFNFAVRTSALLASTVTVNEGQTAVNDGTWSDNGSGPVTLSASLGTVVKNAGGTWSWSYTAPDGPSGPTTVTITATGGDSSTVTRTFPLTVTNVAPVIALTGNSTAPLQSAYTLNLGAVTEPGADTISGYSIDWGDSTVENFSGSPVGAVRTHTYTATGARTIRVSVTDEDGTHQAGTKAVTVSNTAPQIAAVNATVTVSEGTQAANNGTFSDLQGNATVTLTANIGTILRNNTAGTWGWSYTPADGPAGPVTVTITATDNGTPNLTANTTFTLTTNSAAPAFELGLNESLPAGSGQLTRAGSFTDAGQDAWTGTVDYGDGSGPQTLTLNPDKSFNLSRTYALTGIYTVSVTIRDTQDGLELTDSFQLTVQLNRTPTDITLSSPAVPENEPADSSAGTLLAADADAGDTHTFELIPGAGDDDNGLFSIDGNVLRTAFTADYETKNSYTVRVKVTDSGSPAASFEKQLTIAIADANEPPSFTKGTNLYPPADAGSAQSVPGWATAVTDGDSSAVQSLTFTVSVISGGQIFSTPPVIDPVTGNLAYTLSGTDGPAVLSVTLRDDNSINGTAAITTGALTFTIAATLPMSLIGPGEAGAGVAGSRVLSVRPGPVMSMTGRPAWRTYLKVGVGGVTNLDYQGLWAEDENGIDRLIARQGIPAPLPDGSVSTLKFDVVDTNPTYNINGTLAFKNLLTGTGTDAYSKWALFSGRPGAVRRIARAGDPATADLPTVYLFTNQAVINDLDTVSIRTQFRAAAGITTMEDSALVLYKADGSRQIIARESVIPAKGKTSPGSWPGATGLTPWFAPGAAKPFEDFIGGMATITSLFHNNSGFTIFSHRLKGAAIDGIWRHDGQALTAVMMQGTPAPGLGALLYGKPGYPSLSNAGGDPLDDKGRVVFQTLLTGTGTTTANNQAIFWHAVQQQPSLFVRTGEKESTGKGPAGIHPDAKFTVLGTPIISPVGEFAFKGTLATGVAAGGVTTANDTGIWRTRLTAEGEDYELLAREGWTAPDSSGNLRTGVTFKSFSDPVTGEDARAAFVATLSNNAQVVITVDTAGVMRQAMTNEAPVTINDIDTGYRTVSITAFSIGTTPAAPVPQQQRQIGGGRLIAHAQFSDGSSCAMIAEIP